MQLFKVKSQFDTLRNLNFVTFASKTITHDSFNKTFKTETFDYHKNYEKQNHLKKGEDGIVVPFFNFARNRLGDFIGFNAFNAFNGFNAFNAFNDFNDFNALTAFSASG